MQDFVRFSGGDPSQHRDALPPHLFSQWSLPVLLEAAAELPYPPVKVINAGFRLEVLEPLPYGRELGVRGQILRVEETERRAEITALVETTTGSGRPHLRAEIDVIVPTERSRSERAPSGKKERPRVPLDARLIAQKRLRSNAGLEFAELSGDFNPIHWIPAYARAMRFPNVILHGFGTAAIAHEAVGRALLSGRFDRIRRFEAKFLRPVVLPGEVSVFVSTADGLRREVFVGESRGGPLFLSGSVEIGAG